MSGREVSICVLDSCPRLRGRHQLKMLQVRYSAEQGSVNGALDGRHEGALGQRALADGDGRRPRRSTRRGWVLPRPSERLGMCISGSPQIARATPNLVNDKRIGGKAGVCVIVTAHHPQASTPLLTTARLDVKKA